MATFYIYIYIYYIKRLKYIHKDVLYKDDYHLIFPVVVVVVAVVVSIYFYTVYRLFDLFYISIYIVHSVYIYIYIYIIYSVYIYIYIYI